LRSASVSAVVSPVEMSSMLIGYPSGVRDQTGLKTNAGLGINNGRGTRGRVTSG
jgi:hypothetical protein